MQLLETLEMEPEGSFERTVVCEDDSSVILSADTISRVQATLARLEEQQEANRKRAGVYRDRIEAIVAKLNKGQVGIAAYALHLIWCQRMKFNLQPA